MSIEVFFNMPARPFDLSRLFSDIKGARNILVIASAWFTDAEIARAFIDARATQKIIILNQSDVDRGSKRAYEMIREWDEKRARGYIQDYPDDFSGLIVLGSSDWQEGVMHHKFVLVDREVVWAGSYNLTYQARKNYETFLRIQDSAVRDRFLDETKRLVEEQILFGGGQYAQSHGAFRCYLCRKLLPDSAVGDDMGSWIMCAYCKEERKRT